MMALIESVMNINDCGIQTDGAGYPRPIRHMKEAKRAGACRFGGPVWG